MSFEIYPVEVCLTRGTPSSRKLVPKCILAVFPGTQANFKILVDKKMNQTLKTILKLFYRLLTDKSVADLSTCT